MSRDPTLGRRCGIFIPAYEVEAYQACGWIILDELASMTGAGGLVLMGPPAIEERDAA